MDLGIFGVLSLVAVVGVLLVVGAATIVLMRRGPDLALAIDLGELYFLIISLATLLMAFFSILGLTRSLLDLALRTYEPPPYAVLRPVPAEPIPTAVPSPETAATPMAEEPPKGSFFERPPDFWVREQIAQAGAGALIAIPLWVFHWRRARRFAQEKGPSLLYRLYLYGIMILALLVVLVSANTLLSQVLRALLGTVVSPDIYEQRIFWKELLSSPINGGLAAAIWAYHWRLTSGLPREEKEAAA